MKFATRSLLLALSVAALLQVSCRNEVMVVDSRTGRPIPGASVYKQSGNLSTPRHITNRDGVTPTPQLPGANRWTGVVSKPGYRTVRL